MDGNEEVNTVANPVVTQPAKRSEDDQKFKNGNDTERSDLKSVLGAHKSIHIHQLLDVVEVLLGWQRNNRYQVLNDDGDQVLYIFEVADCYARQCLGGLREFSLKATIDGQDVMSVHRPLRCTSRCCWFCCNLQQLKIFSPLGTLAARVEEIWTCFTPTYHIYHPSGSLMYTMTAQCCKCRCCSNFSFKIKNENQEVVSTITKIWGGCKDIIGAANDFTIDFSDTLDPQQRSIIFGASFLLDFNYFEKHGRCW